MTERTNERYCAWLLELADRVASETTTAAQAHRTSRRTGQIAWSSAPTGFLPMITATAIDPYYCNSIEDFPPGFFDALHEFFETTQP